MSLDTALPTGQEPTAGVQSTEQPANTADQGALQQSSADGAEKPDETGEQPEKKEKTPEQREIDRLRRGIDRKTRQLAEARAQANYGGQQQPRHQEADNNQDDDQPVSLTRKELDALVTERAAKLAPTIKQAEAMQEQRQSVVQGLAKEWGQEKFDAYASDLDEAFGGLVDRSGKPKPATDAIFESEMPRDLIEYLADPENADEAESIGNMNDRQAARAIVKLEHKIQAAKQEAKLKDKPKPSSAAPPIEAVRGGGSSSDMPDPSNVKAYIKWANEQERRK